MKTLIPFLVFCLIATCNAELRTWTSIVGTKVEAELVSLTGNQVTLKTKAGKTLKLPLNKLSKADQEFLTAKSSPKQTTKEETPVNPNLKYEVKDSAVTITGCDSKASGELIIPATIEDYPVTSIGSNAFFGRYGLKSITIPDGVTSIGDGAFNGCYNMTSITIPKSVTSIGEIAFYICTNLKSITIPEGVTSIESSTFGNSGLTNITIPESVTSIGNAAFQNCESLTKVIFLGDAPKTEFSFLNSSPTIYRKPEAKGWGDKWLNRPVKLIREKP